MSDALLWAVGGLVAAEATGVTDLRGRASGGSGGSEPIINVPDTGGGGIGGAELSAILETAQSGGESMADTLALIEATRERGGQARQSVSDTLALIEATRDTGSRAVERGRDGAEATEDLINRIPGIGGNRPTPPGDDEDRDAPGDGSSADPDPGRIDLDTDTRPAGGIIGTGHDTLDLFERGGRSVLDASRESGRITGSAYREVDEAHTEFVQGLDPRNWGDDDDDDDASDSSSTSSTSSPSTGGGFSGITSSVSSLVDDDEDEDDDDGTTWAWDSGGYDSGSASSVGFTR